MQMSKMSSLLLAGLQTIMQNKKNILLITSSYPNVNLSENSGGGVFVKHFASELCKHANVIVLTQQTIKGEATCARQSGINVVKFLWRGGGKPLSTLKLPRDVFLIASVMIKGFIASLKIGRQIKIDHTLAVWAIPSGIWALSLKLVFGIPYSTWSLGSDIWSYKHHILSRILLRIILYFADNRYADGFELISDVESISKKKCRFLATSRYLPENIEEKADTIPDKKNYLFVGRYHPNKGPDVLLDAVAKLSPSHRAKVHFHLFGEGYLEPELKRVIEQTQLTDTVTLNGFIKEHRAVAYLRACNALIIPSRIESIPVVLSDALKTDSKIIATDVGDMGCILKEYRAGVVVPSESPDDLAAAIADDLFQDADHFAQGRKNLLNLFDVSQTVERFLSDIHHNGNS